jgi:hypothetical protein
LTCYLENCDCSPQQRVKVLPVTNTSVGVTKLAAKEIHPQNTKITEINNLLEQSNKNLKIKMKSDNSPKKTATLSIVFSITISWRRRFGKNLTSFNILRSLNVLKTDKPEPSSETPYTMPL